MKIKERLQRLEKKLTPYQDTKDYHIVFVGRNSDGSLKETTGIISYADGRHWFNPEIYPPEQQKVMYDYWTR
ncbi:MAG: hypothetical protein ACQ9ET_00825 [Nitrosomonadaceae bacterium]